AAAMLGMCYAVGGALIGYHFAGKNLVWSLLALATILGGLSWSGMVAPENEILYLFPSTIFLVAAMFIYSLLYKSEKGKYEVVSNALDVVIYVIVFAFLVGWVGLFR
ncbi:MAG: hypothetical protein OEZ04_10705, partial [Nitrospinota bacterium]|nr:hypothetical protein [Nitrospinota bacterium]